MTEFQVATCQVVKKISLGEVMTYKDVAVAVGKPRSARAVGNALNKNHNPSVPCHRVIRSDGGVGGYARGARRKENILRAEGVSIRAGKVVRCMTRLFP